MIISLFQLKKSVSFEEDHPTRPVNVLLARKLTYN